MGYHYAFGAAAVGMAIGLVQYKITRPKLMGAAANPTVALSANAQRFSWLVIVGFLIALVLVTTMVSTGAIAINAVALAKYVAVFFSLVFLAYYAAIFFFGNLDGTEKLRLGALFLVWISSHCFWAGFGQGGSSIQRIGQE